MNKKYIFSDYEVEIEQNRNFTISYNYRTPIILDCFHDGWQNSNAIHKVIEKYSNDKKLENIECKIDIENIRNCKVPVIDGYTSFSEKELLEQFYQEKDQKKFTDIDINNNDIYTRHNLSNHEYSIEYFCNLTLYFNNLEMLTGVENNNRLTISKLSCIKEDKKVSLNYNNNIYKYSKNDICYTVFPKMIVANYTNGKIKRYPSRNINEYNIEFYENNYYICPKNMKKELYSYSGVRIDKYPLIQKNKPDVSFGTETTIQNENFGSFSCVNILGLPIGGQLDSGITYLYLYHNDGSYVTTYSDGNNRYYDKVGYWDRTANVDIDQDGTQKIYLKNGKIITYTLDGNFNI